MKNSLNAACRVALAGLTHDLGRFAKRAGANDFFTVLKNAAPDGEAAPFKAWSSDEDSIENAVALGRKPTTFLQKILSIASDVASGTSRENHPKEINVAESCDVRLRSIFEAISLSDETAEKKKTFQYVMPLKALSPETLFPKPTSEIQKGAASKEAYAQLWKAFLNGVMRHGEDPVPEPFRRNWPLWLDSFDTGWLTFTGNIPREAIPGMNPEISLYDHGKATAAIATALWCWHEDTGRKDDETLKNWDEKKFLLIQGDFFGIQNFIFSEGSETNKRAAQILRGRSFYVSLLSELAALRVLRALNLPTTSQILNAAGKFLIVAPNTEAVKATLLEVKEDLDSWFIKNTFAVAGIGLVATEASCRDFVDGHYPNLTKKLFEILDKAKFQRFDLVNFKNPVLQADFSKGVCAWQSRLPADKEEDGEVKEASCALSRDQKSIGRHIPKFERILIATGDANLSQSGNVQILELPIFGLKVAFVQSVEDCRVFGPLAKEGKLLRCWDFTLPKTAGKILWNGFARRNINGYVPRYTKEEIAELGEDTEEGRKKDAVKLFSDIARADSHNGFGLKALMTVKGDVDNLGLIFQKGLSTGNRNMTFAKTAALSRQMNAFFAVWLPWICQSKFKNTYTVFAGGDDFFMIGPWKEAQSLAKHLQKDFVSYVGNNPEVHFSVGTTLTKPGVPVNVLAETAEEALSEAKSQGKNSVLLYGCCVGWKTVHKLDDIESYLMQIRRDKSKEVSLGYLYSLFEILDMTALEKKKHPEAAMWRSKLYYSTARLFERNKGSRAAMEETCVRLSEYIGEYQANFRIPLTNVFYSIRKER